jgi:CheY-like chemotaxis protein
VNDQDLLALGLVVVLAEDNDDHALLIKMALERAASRPVETHRARNGTEAVHLVQTLRPDLLLLDLKMPGKSGHEVLELIKGDPELRKVPVAVLTSSDRDEDIARSYGLGGNHFLTKPQDPAELEIRLKALLANLGEMGEIRRGPGEVRASGESALGPDTLQRRSLFGWIALSLILLALFLFGRCSGAFG